MGEKVGDDHLWPERGSDPIYAQRPFYGKIGDLHGRDVRAHM